jgi:hypothetical protein
MSVVLCARIPEELGDWVDAYAKRRDTTRQVILGAALRAFRRECEVGEPELPVRRRPDPPVRRGGPRRLDSPSDVERWAMERQARLNKAKGGQGGPGA